MTRTSHHPHATPGFPVYCLAWAGDGALVLGGGGGPSRSGIDNKLKLASVSADGRKLAYTSELVLSRDEDAPMTLAVDRESKTLVTGINAARASLEAGRNEQCRAYTYADDQIAFSRGAQTIDPRWSGNFDDYPYQKLTAISPDAALLAVGTTDNAVALLWRDSLARVPADFELAGELVDLSFGGPEGNWVKIYEIGVGEKGEESEKGEQAAKVTVTPRDTILPPDASLAFRSARLATPGATTDDAALLAVLNAAKRGRGGAPARAHVVRFAHAAGAAPGDAAAWKVAARREVASKPVTVCDVSENGKLVAYGCSDLSLGILDAQTLAPLLKILHAHSFPPTALKFNPAANLLVSASADNTVRVVVVPSSFDGWSPTLLALVLALLVLALALALRR